MGRSKRVRGGSVMCRADLRTVKRALDAVKRGQAEIKYRAALNDAYAEHLSVLEMTLMGAVEQAGAGTSGQTNRS